MNISKFIFFWLQYWSVFWLFEILHFYIGRNLVYKSSDAHRNILLSRLWLRVALLDIYLAMESATLFTKTIVQIYNPPAVYENAGYSTSLQISGILIFLYVRYPDGTY